MESRHDWIVPGYEDLELSTQMLVKEALARGYGVDVLDRKSSFIRIVGKGKIEYVRQATRTSADSYVAPLIMENKKVTKILLDEAGIRAPRGRDYGSLDRIEADWPFWESAGAVVVKPNSTNFGTAVSILQSPCARGDFLAAARAAFDEDDTVLAEEFLSGKEYRFLVIDGIARAVLRRVPANVTGDGRSTIAELVERKNADPRRGTGYRSPLERIRLGDEEERHLRAQGLGFSSIPEAGTTVFLRKNSNVSTGGDSVDFTDGMHGGYKDIAAAAAAAVGARICGVDMMVDDPLVKPNATNYGVIELNFNPAIHIHDFPHEGTNRAVERFVLDAIEL
jgi:glutamate--cysteine ligase